MTEYHLNESLMNQIDEGLDELTESLPEGCGPELYASCQLLAAGIAVASDASEEAFVSAARRYYQIARAEHLEQSQDKSQLN